MSKSIASYPPEQRRAVIQRRLAQNSRGCGYWAARSAAEKLGIPVPAEKKHTPRRAPKRDRDNNDGDQAPAKRRHRAAPGTHKPFMKLKTLAR